MWSTVCAEGLYGEHGCLGCLDPKGKIFIVNPRTATTVVSII